MAGLHVIESRPGFCGAISMNVAGAAYLRRPAEVAVASHKRAHTILARRHFASSTPPPSPATNPTAKSVKMVSCRLPFLTSILWSTAMWMSDAPTLRDRCDRRYSIFDDGDDDDDDGMASYDRIGTRQDD